jgi:hypothetical protein
MKPPPAAQARRRAFRDRRLWAGLALSAYLTQTSGFGLPVAWAQALDPDFLPKTPHRPPAGILFNKPAHQLTGKPPVDASA